MAAIPLAAVVIPTANSSTYPYSPTGRFATDWTNGYLEPIALMGVLAGLTSRIKLGTSVLVVPYRNPVVTAKMLATLDVMSGGRVILGAGVGWHEEEFALMGVPHKERGRRMDEMLAFAKECGPNVGLELDSWHWHHAGGTTKDIIHAGKENIINVQVNDSPDLPRDPCGR